MNPLVYTVLMGAVAGWLASFFTRSIGFGIIGNIIAGVVGAFIGTWVLSQLNYSFGQTTIGQILTAAVGAVVFNLIFGLFRRS